MKEKSDTFSIRHCTDSSPVLLKQRGMALLMSLMILLVFTLITTSYFKMSIIEEKIAGNQNLATKALFGAERGVAEAIEDIGDGTASGPTDLTTTAAKNWEVSASVSGADYNAKYTIRYLSVAEGTANEEIAITLDEGEPYYQISSVGYSGPEGALARRELKIGVRVDMASSGICPFQQGIIGCDRVYIGSDSETSSFSSAQWLAEQPSSTNSVPSALRRNNGDVKTVGENSKLYIESSACIKGDVYASNNVYVDNESNCSYTVAGDVFANGDINWNKGDLGGVAKAEGNISGISGDEYMAEDIVPLEQCDPLDIDQIFTDAWAQFSVLPATSRSTTSFNGGDYYFSGNGPSSINIHDDTRFYVSGSLSGNNIKIHGDYTLTIFLKGSFSMNSRGSNYPWVSGISSNLMIYMDKPDPKNCSSDIDDGGSTIEDPPIFFGDNSVFFGVIYAPNTPALIKDGSDVHGAIRGSCVQTLSQGQFFYDEELADLCVGSGGEGGGGGYTYKVLYWDEIY